MAQDVIEIRRFINDRRMSGFQFGVVALCALSLFLDGFDTQSISFVAPAIVQEWHFQRGALGPIFVASGVGMLFGSMGFGPLADKLGRRSILILTTVIVGAGTLLTSTSDSITQLIVYRFLTGLGIGGAYPSAIALTAEYCPDRNRAKLLLIMSTGFTLGAAVAGGVAASIIPAFGWRAVWYIGGVVPLLFVPVQWFLLPESIGFLVVTAAVPERIGALLQRVDKSFRPTSGTRYDLAEARAPGVPVVHLFREGRGVGTVLLWLVFFLNLFDFFLLTNWLPTLANAAGLPMQAAIVAGMMFMIGGLVAAWLLGFPMDRFGPYGVLTIIYAAGFVVLLMLSQAGASYAVLLALIFGTGFCVAGGQNSVNALSAIFYPVSMRSTGVGWAFGIGRIGAIIGPLTAGFLVSSQLGNSSIFIVAAIAMFVAAVAIFIMSRISRPMTATRNAPPP